MPGLQEAIEVFSSYAPACLPTEQEAAQFLGPKPAPDRLDIHLEFVRDLLNGQVSLGHNHNSISVAALSAESTYVALDAAVSGTISRQEGFPNFHCVERDMKRLASVLMTSSEME